MKSWFQRSIGTLVKLLDVPVNSDEALLLAAVVPVELEVTELDEVDEPELELEGVCDSAPGRH